MNQNNMRKVSIKTLVVGFGLAVAAMVAIGLVSAKPASAATKTIFSSNNNVRIFACKSSSTGYRFGAQSLSSSPIYRVSFVDSTGRGNYLENVPGYYGSKMSPYAQAKRDGTRYVKLQWSKTGKTYSLGSFSFKHASLPNC